MNRKTVEEMDADKIDLTQQELDKLHKNYKQSLMDDNNSDSSSDTDSDDNSSQDHKNYVVKSIRTSPKKETTMLYMFKKYELLQTECNDYKNKLYKMRIKAHTEEQKQHYKNLEFSNLLLEKQGLQKDLDQKRYITIKYYISLTTNFLLGGGLLFMYKFYNEL
jgi:hypothetical protein